MRDDQELGQQDLAILVVEDELIARKELVRLLARRGYHVREAAEATGALEEASSGAVGVALIDIRLGAGPDGIETAKILQERQPWVSVVIVSAYVGDPMVREEAQLSQVQIASWIEKPVAIGEVGDFLTLISTELRRAKLRKKVYAEMNPGTTARDILESSMMGEPEAEIEEILIELELRLKPSS